MPLPTPSPLDAPLPPPCLVGCLLTSCRATTSCRAIAFQSTVWLSCCLLLRRPLICPGCLLHCLLSHRLCHSTPPLLPLDVSLPHLAPVPLTPLHLLLRIPHPPWQAFCLDAGRQRMSGRRWEHCLVFGRVCVCGVFLTLQRKR